MSVEVSTRVWTHSRFGGSQLVLLLALANRADEDGLCWPGIADIMQKCRCGERRTQQIIAEVEASGELYAPPAAGRGHRTDYFVCVGLAEALITNILVRRYEYSAERAAVIAAELKGRQAPRKSYGDTKGLRSAAFRRPSQAATAPRSTEKVQNIAPFPKPQKVQNIAPFTPIKGATIDTEKVQHSTRKGATIDITYKDETSLETSVQTSLSVQDVVPEPESARTPDSSSSPIPTTDPSWQPAPEMLHAVLEVLQQRVQFEMGTVSPNFRTLLMKLLVFLERTKRTVADVKRFATNWPLYLNRPAGEVSPPTVAQMLDSFDRVVNFKAKGGRDGQRSAAEQRNRRALHI